MITLRRSACRGHADHGWLKSRHSFSFADYLDPAHMGVGNLRVINEDRIAPGTGFGMRGHRDVEIVSYVLSGALGHENDLDRGGCIVPGDVQRLSAGRGIRHREFNDAAQAETHFLQIWLTPEAADLPPGCERKHFPDAERRGRLRLVASRDGRDGAVTVHADASMYAGLFDGDEAATLPLDPQRLGYVHLVRGRLHVNGQRLDTGDGVTLRGEARLVLAGGCAAEVIVFDLAA